MHKYNISGTSDIACLLKSNSNLSRSECRFCIEIKRVSDMAADSATNKALREGMLQLLGLNVGNSYTSPSVIVTNLNRKHFLLFICQDKDQFFLKILRFINFGQAVSFAQNLVSRGGITKKFGSAPTPPPSCQETSDNGKVQLAMMLRVMMMMIPREVRSP